MLLLLGGGMLAPLKGQVLDTVAIQAWKSLPLQPGHRFVSIDSLSKAEFEGQSLGDLLAAQSDVFIKSYGQGSLATTSLRGGGASHTALVWNGIPLQNAMNGQADLSLLPSFFLDEVGVQYGGSATLYGSGAVGGALHLNNDAVFGAEKRVRLFGQAGSFDQYMLGADVKVGTQKAYSRTRIFTRRAENDFGILGKDGRRQPHAALWQNGILQEAAVRLSPKQELHLWLWGQQSDRELPPPLTRDTSASFQQDQFQRILLTYKYAGERIEWKARAAYLGEKLNFQDSLAEIFSENRSLNLITEGEGIVTLSPTHTLQVGLTHTLQQASADGYGDGLPRRSLAALFASYKVQDHFKRFAGVLSLRQGLADGVWNPFLPSLSLSYRLNRLLAIKGQAGRTFRLPTFNDLYWNPGGNDSLRPEQGWHQEVGLYGERSFGTAQLLWHLTGFNQRVENWIFWRPGADFWYPENLRTVWSRGLETEMSLRIDRGNLKGMGRIAYTHTRSTVVETVQARDRSLGQQLIYTPEHQGRVYARLQYKQTYFSYTHSLVGRRYTSTDNEFFLPAYHVGSLQIGQQMACKWPRVTLGLRLNNFWNQSYQVIENRAMPGRNFLLTLSLTSLFSRPAD